MRVSVEKSGKLGRKVRVELAQEKVDTEVNKRLQNLTKTARVQGFRPGKVPLKIIRSRYGVKVRQEVVGEFVQSSFYEAVTQENLKPVGLPRIDDIADEPGAGLSYLATFEVYPDVELKPVDKIDLEKPVCKVTDDDIANMVETLRKQRKALKQVDRASQATDIIDINFESYVDGKVFHGSKAEHYQLELGAGSFIEGFEDGLTGKSAGEQVTLHLKFPEDYGDKKLNGKDVEFRVSVNTVNEPVLPEVDAGFMQGFGVKDGDAATFKNELKRNMEREVEMTIRRHLKDSVLNKLNEVNSVELPEIMVENERTRIRQELENNLKKQKIGTASIAKADPGLFTEQAKKRVSLHLIMGEIIKRNEIKADPEKVRQMITTMASGYEDPDAIFDWYYSDQKNLAQVEALAVEEEIVDWFLDHANVTEKACTFDEIMNKGQTAT